LLSSAPEVGGILVVHAPSGGDDNAAIEALIACAKTVKIPLLIAAMGEQTGLPHRHLLAQAGLACFETPEAAISGFRHLIRNRRNRAAARELPASKVLQTAADAGAAQQVFMAARTAGQSALNRDQALALAAAYHIPVVAGGHAATPEAAATLACRIGFPVVVKLSHPDLPANRITGSIQFDLPDGPAVQRAAQLMFEGLSQRGAWLPGADFLVQHQAPRGTQLRILVADHEIFGPVIGFGPGGGDPDDFSALAIGLPPLNLPLAQALIERASVAPQLAAHRGAPAADLNAVAASLVRISQMIIDHTEILRLDLDPLFAYEAGVVAASAKITLRPPAATRPSLIISPYPSEWISHQTFGGEAFTLRPVRPEDADAHAELFARLSPEDVRYRFFSAIRRLPDEAVVRMTDVDYHREMAIIAKRDETGETAGVARLVRNDTDGLTAEFAVLVEAAAKGKGLASALMKAIIAWGAAQSVREINGQILADNQPMLTFIRRLGFTVERIVGESDIVEARLSL